MPRPRTGKRKGKGEVREAAPVVTLSADDQMGLRSRLGTWRMQADRVRAEMALADMAKESYEAFVAQMRTRYELPDRWEMTEDGGVVPLPPAENVETITGTMAAASDG